LIAQNTQGKSILRTRGDPETYGEDGVMGRISVLKEEFLLRMAHKGELKRGGKDPQSWNNFRKRSDPTKKKGEGMPSAEP